MKKEPTKEDVMECLEYLASAHEDLRIAIDDCEKRGVKVLHFCPTLIQINYGLAETDIEAARSDHDEVYDKHEYALDGVTFIQLEVKNR